MNTTDLIQTIVELEEVISQNQSWKFILAVKYF